MTKKRTTVSIENELLVIARKLNLNVSEIANDALDAMIRATFAQMKESGVTLESLIEERESRIQRRNEICERIRKERQQLEDDMRIHIKTAKEAGKTRGEAEVDFGKLFPDHLWNEG